MGVKSKLFSSLERAFTLIEIVIVIAIIGGLYAVIAPNLTVKSTAEVMGKLDRLSGDVRSAFDLAILNHRAYRLVFHLNSGKYWLEETDAQNFYLGGEKEGDLSEKEEKEKAEEFNQQFDKYMSLAGEAFKDEKGKVEIPQMFPLIRAKDRLQRPKWRKVTSIEWNQRELAPILIIKDMRAEHHREPVTLEGRDSDENFAHLYFLPSGYVERAYFHLYYLKGSGSVDESQPPYTIKTNPYRGEASVINGLEQVDLANPLVEE